MWPAPDRQKAFQEVPGCWEVVWEGGMLGAVSSHCFRLGSRNHEMIHLTLLGGALKITALFLELLLRIEAGSLFP